MNEIKEIIIKELKKLSIEAEISDLDLPKNIANGDYSFFVKDKSVDLVNLPVEKISHKYIEKVETAGRFINFHLSKKFFSDALAEILADEMAFGRNKRLGGEKVIIEYTQPNPFKEFHIGHLMSNSIGESLSRIIEWNGAKITRANYQGDIGPHVAKAIWAMQSEKLKPKDLTAEIMGRLYVLGSAKYEEDPQAKKEIDEINKQVYTKADSEINALYDAGRKISLERFEEIYKTLGTEFTKGFYFFESQTAPDGIFIVEELLKKGILEKSDGAVVFKGEQYGFHTRVFINSQGLPTYETKELGLSKMKFAKGNFDRSIVITASEQKDYFNVLLKVLGFYNAEIANKTKNVTHGMMRFAEGKMSSRKGNVITAESMIDDIEKLVLEKIADRDFSDAQKKEIAEMVAVGAIKYSILKQSPGRDIIFDFAKSLSFEGDSGPYLQYTHARINSVLAKAAEAGIKESANYSDTENPGELEHLLVRLPEIIERAEREFAPQLITTYLINLASAFNTYYANNIILSDDKMQSAHRVALAHATKNALAVGLYILGIKAPDRM